jgi:DNA-binding beta-propeller fold protein YncE
MRRNLLFVFLAALLAVGAAGTATAGSQKKKAKAANSKKVVLEWPLPPDKPRIRYIKSYSNNFDVEPRKKRSWIQRLVGTPDPNVTLYFTRPGGAVTDSRGRIYVASMQKAMVFILEPKQRKVYELRGDRGIALQNPLGLAVDGKDNLYVADPVLHMVLKFDPAYHLVATLGQQVGMKNPTFMAIDKVRRRLYVVDSHLHQVLVYNIDTLKPIGRIGKRGSGKGEFNYPVGIAVNKQGDIAVSDTGSCSVEEFTPDYKFIRRIGTQGTGPGMFTRPKGVAFDSDGNLYVVDAAFNNFQIFSPKGRILMFVGSFGSGPGEFNLPLSISIDAKNRLYVTDELNARVQIFQFLGGS